MNNVLASILLTLEMNLFVNRLQIRWQRQMSSNTFKILIIADEWEIVQVSSINDSYSDLNFNKFTRKKDIRIANAPIVAIPPSSITSECIVIPVSDED